jgi:hypothetical protein
MGWGSSLKISALQTSDLATACQKDHTWEVSLEDNLVSAVQERLDPCIVRDELSVPDLEEVVSSLSKKLVSRYQYEKKLPNLCQL